MQKLNNNVLNEDYVFIKGFFKITLTDICKRLNISRTYLTAGGYTEDVYRKVKKEIEKEIARLYLGGKR